MAASEPPVDSGDDLEPSPPCPLHYFSPPRSVVHCVSTYVFSFRWQKTYNWLKYTVTGALHTHIVLLLARTDTHTHTHAHAHAHTHAHAHAHNENRENKNRARRAVKENSSGTAELS